MPPLSVGFGYGFAVGDAATEAAHLQPVDAAGWGGSAGTFFFVEPATKATALLMTHVLPAPPSDVITVARKLVARAALELIVR